jgi:hypothetical protein
MKKIIVFCFIILCASCKSNNPEMASPGVNSDSLHQLLQKYAPGLGEIMGGIQTHHAKLWYAGINYNWKLAQYESDELKERFVQATQVQNQRPEVKMIPMMYPVIDSINQAIGNKNLNQFKSGFQLLTNSCNSCHSANNFGFNIIIIPGSPPVYNQNFKAQN